MNLSEKLKEPQTNERSKFLVAYAFTTVIFVTEGTGDITATLMLKDPTMLERIISGKSRGISPSVIIRNWECSICHGNYEKCPHEEGSQYDGVICQLIAKNIEFTGASLVDEPKDPRCRVNDLLVISSLDGKKLFEWYGFELYTENIRFKDIQHAYKSKLISQKAAFRLSELFSVKLYGVVRFTE